MTAIITVQEGCAGYFAVCMVLTSEGHWEPESTGFGRYATRAEAVEEARQWAEAEKLELDL